MGYRIGSFNLRNLGAVALSKKNPRDLAKIAEIIRRERFDVVALQEIFSEGKAVMEKEGIKRSILMELGAEWDFQWADAETSLKDHRGEGYGFLWNRRRLGLSTTPTDRGERTFHPRICQVRKQELMRKPYYARFTPAAVAGGPWFEIRLLCIHAYYGGNTADAWRIRQHELNVLMKEIYPQVADRRYGNNMPSYTFLLGDYNALLYRRWKEQEKTERNAERMLQGKSPIPRPAYLQCDENDEIISNYKDNRGENRRIKTVQDQYTTLKSVQTNAASADDGESGGYANDYDHFSYEERLLQGIGKRWERVDAVGKYCQNDFEQYHKTVSDHIPIVMEIEPNNLLKMSYEIEESEGY